VLHEISGLEIIMDHVKNLHQQLADKKEMITRSINLHKGPVSTLWRFPNEFFAQNFHCCLQNTVSLNHPLWKALTRRPNQPEMVPCSWPEYADGGGTLLWTYPVCGIDRIWTIVETESR
jgi:hypothetical protein